MGTLGDYSLAVQSITLVMYYDPDSGFQSTGNNGAHLCTFVTRRKYIIIVRTGTCVQRVVDERLHAGIIEEP